LHPFFTKIWDIDGRRHRNRWEFLLMVTPLALPNAHRIAPVNPVAMF